MAGETRARLGSTVLVGLVVVVAGIAAGCAAQERNPATTTAVTAEAVLRDAGVITLTGDPINCGTRVRLDAA